MNSFQSSRVRKCDKTNNMTKSATHNISYIRYPLYLSVDRLVFHYVHGFVSPKAVSVALKIIKETEATLVLAFIVYPIKGCSSVSCVYLVLTEQFECTLRDYSF